MPSLFFERMIVINVDSGAEQLDNNALSIRVLCNLGIQYNNGISLSISEDDTPCDEITD